MKAVVFHGIGDIRLEDVVEPRIHEPTDAVVRLTASAICGTDLHMIRGTFPGMTSGTILGHEGVGIVEEVGKGVRNLRPGDRVVIGSTIACGNCSYCRAGYYSQCDAANPNGKLAGTAFFGGPKLSGPFDGLQAEYARVPFAHVGCVKLPEQIEDDQAILCSDIFPTGYMAAEMAEPRPGETVAVFGSGPVGQFVIASLTALGVGRIIAIDGVADRLAMAQEQGAEVIDFNRENPQAALLELTGGIGVDRAVDAVGVDAQMPRGGPGYRALKAKLKDFDQEQKAIAPEQHPHGENWKPGDAPSQVLSWAVTTLAKAGTLSIIGVYPPTARTFPIGEAMNKNLTVRMGNCHHRKYIPKVLDLIVSGKVRPERVLSRREPIAAAIEAYEAFDLRQPGWLKVELSPAAH